MKKLVLITLLLPLLSQAQLATESKIYQNYPNGMQMIQVGYVQQNTNSTVDGDLALPNNDVAVNVNVGYMRYAYFFDIGGKTAGIQAMIPYAGVKANILGFEVQPSGLGDIMLVFGTNITGGDALSFPEFLKTPKRTAIGWSIAVTAPTGQYDQNKLINIGGNRWQFRPEIGVTVPVGKWDFETYVNAKFFTENTEMSRLLPTAEAGTLSQSPFYGLTFHAVYNVNSKLYAAIDLGGRIGGETTKNAVDQDNSQALFGIGGTVTFMPSIHHQFGINYMTRAVGNDIAPHGSIFSIKYAFVFGAQIDKTLEAIKQMQSQQNK